MMAEAICRLTREIGLLEHLGKDQQNRELEARLGSVDPETGQFKSEVDHLWFTTLQRRLDACTDWARKTHWVESEDVFFTDQLGRSVRQSRVCDPSTCQMSLHTVCKERLGIGLMPLVAPMIATAEILPSGVTALRVAQSHEHPVEPEVLPLIVKPLHVCIKQRKSFLLASTTHPGATWSFDLTRRWHGHTREAAEEHQTKCAPTCEIEVEFHAADCEQELESKTVLTSMVHKVVSLMQ